MLVQGCYKTVLIFPHFVWLAGISQLTKSHSTHKSYTHPNLKLEAELALQAGRQHCCRFRNALSDHGSL